MKKSVNFFTYVDKKYYHFILPFLFSFEKNKTENMTCEIVVEDIAEFWNRYGKACANLSYVLKEGTVGGGDVVIYKSSNFAYDNIIPHLKRFVLCPGISNTDYTYIVDVDILLNRMEVIDHNIEGMKRNKTCFFNIVRKDQHKLTGIHFVDTKKYYPKLQQFLQITDVKDFNSMGDEGFLYNFVKGTFGEPEKLTEGNERILPGDHISPNRGKKYTDIYNRLITDGQWKEAFKQFDQKFIDLMI